MPGLWAKQAPTNELQSSLSGSFFPADRVQARPFPHRLRDAPRAAHPRVYEQRCRRRVVLSSGEQLPVCGGGARGDRVQLRPRVPAARRVTERGRGADSVLVPLRRGSRPFRWLSTQRGCFCRLNDAGMTSRDRADNVEHTSGDRPMISARCSGRVAIRNKPNKRVSLQQCFPLALATDSGYLARRAGLTRNKDTRPAFPLSPPCPCSAQALPAAPREELVHGRGLPVRARGSPPCLH